MQGPSDRSLSGAGQSQWAKTLKGKSRTKGVMGRWDAGADHPGGAAMATTSKLQPPGIGGQLELSPKEFLSPIRTDRIPVPPSLPQASSFQHQELEARSPQPGLVFPEADLASLQCALPEVSSPTHGKGKKGAPRTPTFWSSPSQHQEPHKGLSARISLDEQFGAGFLQD